MERWEHFLNSLATKGGNIFLLFMFNLGIIGLCVHFIHAGETQNNVVVGIVALLGNFAGALLYALTGTGGQRKSDANGNGAATVAPVVQNGNGEKPNEK